jgi:hypothetical protein
MEVIQKNVTFCLPPSSKLYLPRMTSTLLSLSTIGALIEVLETLFNSALPFITNPYHNVASIAPSLPSVDAFIKKLMTSIK